MKCPYCHLKTRVSNSRSQMGGFSVWRRRRCPKCQIDFSTSEQIEISSIIKLKSEDDKFKNLRRENIYLSIFKALRDPKATEKAEYLTRYCLKEILSLQQPILAEKILQKLIFKALKSYQPLAAQRYLLNEVGKTKLEPE